MKKQELEKGMVVETRDKLRLIVIGDNLEGKDGYLELQGYKDDMKFGNNHEPGYINLDNFDIMKVYPSIFAITDYKVAQQPLWERREIPHLTNDEVTILRNIDKEYKWIARDKNGILYIYDSVPEKRGNYKWSRDTLHVDILSNLSLFSHLFDFIQWTDDEPYNINDLLMQNKEENKNEN